MKHNFHKLKAILKQQIKIWRIRRHFSQIQKKHTKGSFLNLKPQSCKRFASVAVAITIILSIVAFIPAMQTPHTKAAWYATGGTWNYRKQITFTSDAAKIPSTQTNFPVLISITDAGLASHAQDDGDDILFTSSDQLTKLSHEIESFDGTTGALVAWVKVPSLAASGSIYMYYGEDDIASQQNATDVWSNGYVGVWHMNDAGPTNVSDSKGAYTGTQSGGVSFNSANKIFNGLSYDNTDDTVSFGDISEVELHQSTFSVWAKLNNTAGDHELITKSNVHSPQKPFLMWFDAAVGGADLGTGNTKAISVLSSDGINQLWVATPSNTINDTNWHRITAVLDPSATSTSIYVDGQQSATFSKASWTGVRNTTDSIKGGFLTSGSPTNGYLDEMNISSTTRTANWIAAEYANQNDPATFLSLAAEETGDSIAPTNPTSVTALKSEGGDPISNNSGNDSTPFYSWPAAEADGGAHDTTGGSYPAGVDGYYSYFGTSCGGGGADPASSRGVLSDTGGGLHYSSDTNISVPDLTTNEDTYCLRIKTKDDSGNVSSGTWQAATYKFDITAPNTPTFVAANPTGYSSTNSFAFTWPTATDNGISGLQGYQYKRGNGTDDWTLVATNSVSAIESYQTGENIFIVRAYDNAGNASAQVQTTYYYSNSAPTKPTGLISDPDMFSDTNSFSFSWTAPVHDRPIVSYGYSINAYPTASNLTWTGSSTTSLAADSYATVQGDNTIYLVAKDDSGAYALSDANVASLVFNCQTTAPPIPLNPTISDSSNRAYSTYSLTIKWSAGTGQGLSFDHYIIQRSTDPSASSGQGFTDLATTSSTAYIDISGLSNSTTYYYRIKAVDNADNISAASTIVSRIPTGKYETPPTIIQGPTDSGVKATEATISWVTSRVSTAGVRFGTDRNNLSRSQIDPTEETEHSITIPGLEGGTKYYYQVQSLDNDRDYASEDAYSEVADFTTLALPAISDVKISNITLSTAELSWTTSAASNATLSYGKSISYGTSWSDSESYTTNHTYKFTNLDHTSTYHFKINGVDEDGNSLISDDYVFDTLPMPKISSVNFETDLKETQPKSFITWTTNVPTTSSVDYTPKDGSVSFEESQSSFVTSHKVELLKLSDNTSYSFYVYGTDQFGNKAVSDEYSFATPFDSRAAVISDILTETSNIGLNKQDKAQIVISWTTDEPATSQVEYSEGLSGDQYTQRTVEDKNLTTSHLVIIPGLVPSTPYHFKIISRDKGGNISASEDQSIIAGVVPKSIFNLIMETFDNVFGWMAKFI